METADGHRQAGFDEAGGEVHGPGELVGLHADESDQRPAAALLQLGDDLLRLDAGVGLVIRVQPDLDVRTQHLALLAIAGGAVQRGQSVGRNEGFPPDDRIAVIVVVRRLDHDQMEQLGARDRHAEASRLTLGRSYRQFPPRCRPRRQAYFRSAFACSATACAVMPKCS